MSDFTKSTVLILWDQFGPYHFDRLRAATEHLRERFDVVGVQYASKTSVNLWGEQPLQEGVTLETLFPGRVSDEISRFALAAAVARRVAHRDVAAVFLPGYHRLDAFLAALICRLTGKLAYLMTESKFDDIPRSVVREVVKSMSISPYHGALVAGPRSDAYLRFLGFGKRPIAHGYSTVSRARMLGSAHGEPPAEGQPFLAVARFVPKKNLPFLVAAHSAYVEMAGGDAHPLVIIGEGAMRPAIERAVAAHSNPSRVEVTGALPSAEVAARMRSALALCVPSTEEQWGLVVNEAVFFGLPVLISTNVGSGYSLVRNGLNGFALDPADAESWAMAMLRTAEDHAWRQAARAHSLQLAEQGDTARFGGSALALLQQAGFATTERAGATGQSSLG